MDDRYTRQRRLPEVGDAGQARLERAALAVAAGPDALTELAYLERAGAREILISRWQAPEVFTHAAHFRHAPSRKLGAGSWRALRQINRILESS
ncbi:MAG TPA: hypothetical protein VM686_37205 [Polyangiaceae bacterium]|nr:hypothetical protein [Polyangiaceae bacterium]